MADHPTIVGLPCVLLGPALVLALMTGPASAQPGPEMTQTETEAYQMGRSLTASCSPRRHNSVTGSESLVRRAADALTGTAAFYRSFEGAFLVLEEYDEELAGHCLVFGWFGGSLEPGEYPIRQLSMGQVESEVGQESTSFYGSLLVRTPSENSAFVTESGTLTIGSVDAGGLSGTFTLTGFLIEGSERTDGVTMTGSFDAPDVT